ncbi:hypothetical protein LINPERHAP2_LOCUS15966 [Linum perenne]
MAFMMKLAFQNLKSPNEIWVQVLQHKYFRDCLNGCRLRTSLGFLRFGMLLERLLWS